MHPRHGCSESRQSPEKPQWSEVLRIQLRDAALHPRAGCCLIGAHSVSDCLGERIMLRPITRTISFLCCSIAGAHALLAGEVEWRRIEIDSDFRSEGVAAGDINRDGKIDAINGEAWYEAPEWTMHAIRKLSDYGDGSNGYSH